VISFGLFVMIVCALFGYLVSGDGYVVVGDEERKRIKFLPFLCIRCNCHRTFSLHLKTSSQQWNQPHWKFIKIMNLLQVLAAFHTLTLQKLTTQIWGNN
jgi:hypothetical protein